MASRFDFEIKDLSEHKRQTRAELVAAFKKWLDADPDRAMTPLNLTQLHEQVFLHNSYPSLKFYFHRRRINGDLWGCLCDSARDLYPSRQEIPYWVQGYAERYRARAKLVGTVESVPTAADDQTDDALRKATQVPSHDIEVVTAGVELARRLLEQVKHEPSGTANAATDVVRHAHELADLAEKFLHAFTLDSPDAARRAAIPLFEAGADALRLLSRNPDTEHAVLYRLLTLRRSELEVTAEVRDSLDLSLARYHGAAVQAILMNTPSEEINAVANVISELVSQNVRLTDSKVRETQHGDQIVAIVLRLASYGIVHNELNDKLQPIAHEARKLFDKSDLRNRMNLLLDHAGLGPDRRVPYPTPVSLIRLARYRGVGEFLTAGALIRIADTTERFDATPQEIERTQEWLRPFGIWIPQPGLDNADADAETRANRILLRQRAVVYYTHAITWLRREGTPGMLRRMAIEKRTALLEQLDNLGAAHLPADKNNEPWRDVLYAFEEQFDTMMTNMILRTDFTDASERTLRVSKFLQSLRDTNIYLSNPRGRSLRSDLPPVEVLTRDSARLADDQNSLRSDIPD